VDSIADYGPLTKVSTYHYRVNLDVVIIFVGVDCELLERLVSSFLPTFKDINKKASIYAIIEIRVSQRDRWIA
jgi:hypothetical protein